MVGDLLTPTHLLFLLGLAVLVFGPRRLPEIGSALGRGLRDFRTALNVIPSSPSEDPATTPVVAETPSDKRYATIDQAPAPAEEVRQVGAERPMPSDPAAGSEDHATSRRDLPRRGLLLGLGLATLSMGNRAHAEETQSAHTAGPSLDPVENPSWEGWSNPRLDVPDGWDNWQTILNPEHLPIYHDRFDRIEQARPKHHWVMVIDLRKCVGCQACVVACKSENNVPLGVYRTWVDVYQVGDTVPDPNGDIVVDGQRYRQDVRVMNVPKLCNHCDDPPCVDVCPVKATYKREDGIVLVDPRLCIGCGTCVNACPYDARYLNPVSHTADKCTFCVERIDQGLLPACVTSCVGRARVFGDANDPDSEVSRLLAQYPHVVRHPDFGTKPQVFYIGMSGDIGTVDDPEIQHMVFTYTSNANSTVPVR